MWIDGPSQPGSHDDPSQPGLHALPCDLLDPILELLEWDDLLRLAAVGKTWSSRADEPQLWCTLMQRRYAAVLERFFDGVCPEPADGVSWKEHFLRFQWLNLAVARTGRRIIVVNRRVVDVTDFVDEHPGSAQTLIEATGTDASDAFNAARHSGSARMLMHTHYDMGLPSVPPRIVQRMPAPTGIRRLLEPLGVRAGLVLEEIRRRVLLGDGGYLGGDW
eukprot:3161995-Prymnesium_polylepis.1